MAALTAESNPVKGLVIGDSGAGKTGALASLAVAGFNVRIAAAEKGTEILYHLLKDKPEALARVDVETHMDQYSEQGGVLKPTVPLAGFRGIAKVLTNWPEHGKVADWGPDTVLVLDTITSSGRAILNHILYLNQRLGQQPQLQDWGAAMSLQEDMIAMLTSSAIKCHVLVLAHVAYAQPEGELMTKGYPSALGNKLPPKIGQYFNSTLYMRSEKVGADRKRMIYTDTVGMIECKTSAPGRVKKSYPVETGLADYFRDLGHSPKSK